MTPDAEGQPELSEEDVLRLRAALAGLAGKSEIWQFTRSVQARRRPDPVKSDPDPDRNPGSPSSSVSPAEPELLGPTASDV
jgi:hypothetical protein